jgi:hypothetical protein
MLEHAIVNGRGGCYLRLIKYRKLRRSYDNDRLSVIRLAQYGIFKGFHSGPRMTSREVLICERKATFTKTLTKRLMLFVLFVS